MNMKTCNQCNVIRLLTDFSRDTRRKNGLQGRCKECDKIRLRIFKEKNPNYFKVKGKERYDRTENPARYLKYREKNLDRVNNYMRTTRGRFLTLLNSARGRAKKASVPYELDLEWLMEKYEKQSKCCLLTGIQLLLESNRGGSRAFGPFSPSLDRIIPKLGYTKENTRLVCTFINLAMNHFGEDVFAKVAHSYIERNKNANLSINPQRL